MQSGFLPPVLFTIQANATQAITQFGKVNAQLKAMEAQAAKTGTKVSGMTKAFTLATGAAKALGAVFAGFAAYGVKEAVQLQDAYAKLGVTMANAGISTAENRKQVADLAQSYEKLGFDATNAASAFGVFITAGNDMAQSQKLMGLAADYARVKQIPLEEAARVLTRAQQGSAKAFKEFGITLDANKPKSVAAAEALDKLEKKIGGQAVAYTKTFRGQLAVLGKQVEGVAESIGIVLIPIISKMITGFQKAFKWIGQHKEILIAIAAVISTVLIVAVVNLTRKLWAQAVAWAAANFQVTLVIAAIAALVGAFVWAWNKFDWFRKGVVEGLKSMLKWWTFLLKAIGIVAEGLLQIITGPLRLLLKGLGYFNDDAKKMGETLDKIPAKVGDFFDNAAKKVYGWIDVVDTLKDKKIDFSGFKLPGLDIPKFKNGAAVVEETGNEISDAWIAAMQRIFDFNKKFKDGFNDIKASFKSMVSRNYVSEVTSALANPIDELIKKAQISVTAYEKAARQISGAQTKLHSAQVAYANAVKSGNKQLIASTESNLKRAEEAANKLQDSMKKNLESIKNYQSDMIAAVIDAANQIKDLRSQQTKAAAEGRAEEAQLTKDYLAEKLAMEVDSAQQAASAVRDAYKRQMELIKSSIDSMRNVFKSATAKSIGDIYDSLTYQGKYLKGGTTEKILGALLGQTKKAETLAGDAAKLSGLGFTQTFIEEVMAQGPDVGHSLATTIINSSPESIKQMKEYWEKLQATTTHGVDDVANEINSRLGLATEEMRQTLTAIPIELNTQLKEMADALQIQLKASYDKYNEALQAIKDKNKAIVDDIDAQVTALKEKIAQLETALSKLSGMSATPDAKKDTTLTEKPGTVTKKKTAPVIILNTIGESAPTPPPTPSPPPLPSLPPSVRNAIMGQSPAAGAQTPLYGGMAPVYGKTAADARGQSQIVVGGNTINVSSQTNASPQQIAQDVGWAIRTSADVQYYMVGGKKITVPADRGFG